MNGQDRETEYMSDDAYEVFTRVEKVAGWLTKPAAYFTIDILGWQEREKIKGGLLEIGVFCGKYFSLLMRSALATNAPILGIDTFQYNTKQRVLEELTGVLGKAAADKAVLWSLPSVAVSASDIEKEIGKCRFISIDGAHDYENVFRDLVLAEQILSIDGLIAADDFLNPLAIGVNQAINAFLFQPRAIVPVAYTANKLFFAHRARADEYRVVIEGFFERGDEQFAKRFREQRGHGRHHIEQEFYGSKVILG
jgi:hypothetical protein